MTNHTKVIYSHTEGDMVDTLKVSSYAEDSLMVTIHGYESIRSMNKHVHMVGENVDLAKNDESSKKSHEHM